MATIPIGTKGEQKLLVTSEVAINFLGMEGARVLSTPHMIGFMERTCRDTVLPLLDQGYDTVGTHVNVAHLAAAPLRHERDLLGGSDRCCGAARSVPGGSLGRKRKNRRRHARADHHQRREVRSKKQG